MPTQERGRILWLLNHKTLMRCEIPILNALGFEAFVPKVIPGGDAYRSTTVDPGLDDHLTLPPDELRRLNAFSFYDTEWPDDIAAIINRRFDAVITAVIPHPLRETLTHFRGQIILRAFGLASQATYGSVMRTLVPAHLLERLHGEAGSRFWFGAGYEQLAEVESPFIARRTVLLPVGLDDAFWSHAGTWTGGDRHILFLCASTKSNPYYAGVYKRFKATFGRLPHVIVGPRDSGDEDPNIIGYVSDDELLDLYRRSAALYYHSTEPRHLHYHPIESMIIGTPTVFHRSNLLGRVSPPDTPGMVVGDRAARHLLVRLLRGEPALVEDLRERQSRLVQQFTRTVCERAWHHALLYGELGEALRRAVRRRTAPPGRVPPPTSPADGGGAFPPVATAHELLSPLDPTPGQPGTGTPHAPDPVLRDAVLARLDGDRSLLEWLGDAAPVGFDAEDAGAGDIVIAPLPTRPDLDHPRLELGSRVRLARLHLPPLPGGDGAPPTPAPAERFDLVVINGALDGASHPLADLERIAPVAREALLLTIDAGFEDVDRPAMLYRAAERGETGYGRGFAPNARLLTSYLADLGFDRRTLHRLEGGRLLIIATRHDPAPTADDDA